MTLAIANKYLSFNLESILFLKSILFRVCFDPEFVSFLSFIYNLIILNLFYSKSILT